MNATNKIKQIEKILGTTVDGVWGDDDKTALGALTKPKAKAPVQQEAPPTGGVSPTGDMMNAEPTTYK